MTAPVIGVTNARRINLDPDVIYRVHHVMLLTGVIVGVGTVSRVYRVIMDRIAMIVQIPVQMKTVTRPPASVTQIAPMTGVDSIVRVSKKCLKALPIVHNVPLGFTALTAINIVLPPVMDIDVTSLRDCVTDVLQVGTAINVIVEETAMRVDVVFLATATRAHRGTGVRTVYKYACTTVVKMDATETLVYVEAVKQDGTGTNVILNIEVSLSGLVFDRKQFSSQK